jgi:hypothetical protein
MAEEAIKLVVVDEANGKFIVNEGWRPIAKGLIEKYTELKHIAPDSLVFIDNISDTGKSRNIFRFANTNKVPPKWSDVLHQLSGKRFDYYIEFFKTNTDQLADEQIVALVYRQLRYINKDGEIIHPDIMDFVETIDKLGPVYLQTKARIPNLLDADVSWDKIKSQPNLFESYTKLQLVKGGDDGGEA